MFFIKEKSEAGSLLSQSSFLEFVVPILIFSLVYGVTHFENWSMHNCAMELIDTISCFGINLCSGYLAPEYAIGGQLTMKADVYSFGVLILEIISAKSSARTNWGGSQKFLLEWVRNFQFPIFTSYYYATSYILCFVTFKLILY